ncbi:hypothetical protein D5086_017342 [Populus alba]|uniref:Uncharacterized protein n=1 Tax=Populus alba TaxID=43335 RepID=A0ACC4BWL5_POPAL
MDVKLLKARKQGNLLAYLLVPHTQLIRFQPPSKGKAPAISSLGGIFTSDCYLPIINNGKEPVGVVSYNKYPNVVPVGVTTIRGQKRSSSKASGSGKVPLPPLPM